MLPQGPRNFKVTNIIKTILTKGDVGRNGCTLKRFALRNFLSSQSCFGGIIFFFLDFRQFLFLLLALCDVTESRYNTVILGMQF